MIKQDFMLLLLKVYNMWYSTGLQGRWGTTVLQSCNTVTYPTGRVPFLGKHLVKIYNQQTTQLDLVLLYPVDDLRAFMLRSLIIPSPVA